jgi:uncharacterized membrane protein YeaQ/YmgE (transglycosylase-associated protein family)
MERLTHGVYLKSSSKEYSMLFAMIGWAIFGLIVGAIGRLLVPGNQPMGLFKTMLFGIVGSFIGGFLAYLILGGSPLQASGWIGSVLGATAAVALATRGGRDRVDSIRDRVDSI